MKIQCMKVAISAGLISLGMVGTADAALIGRLAATPGGTDYQAYFDDVANLTWLADANYAQTSGYDVDGMMSWQAANAWATQLTVGGVNGWRLANTLQPDSSCNNQSSGLSYGNNCTGSELGNLFYTALGNSAGTLSNTGPFSNVQSFIYLSATDIDTIDAWGFDMFNGYQTPLNKNDAFFGWAVQSGDVGAVPVPAAAWLFSSGLLGLVGVARCKKA